MSVTPFKLYLENKMISKKNMAIFKKDIFEEKCKKEWNNMPDKAKLFWINYAFEQEFGYKEKIKKPKKSSFIRNSSRSILTKNQQPLQVSMANNKPEKPGSSGYTYQLFHRSMLDSEEVINMKQKEKNSYIAQCWQNCKPEQEREYDNAIKILPTLKVDKKRIRKTKGETSKDKMEKIKPIVTKEKNDFLTNGPDVPPACAFYLFMKNYNDLYPHSDDAIYVWRKLSATDKKIYNNVLHDMRKQYAIDYKNYLEGNNFDKVEKYILNANRTHSNYVEQTGGRHDMN